MADGAEVIVAGSEGERVKAEAVGVFAFKDIGEDDAMFGAQRLFPSLARDQSVHEIEPRFRCFIEHLARGDAQRKLVGRMEEVMGHVNLVAESGIDEVGHADALAFPFAVHFEDVSEARIAGARVGEDAADWNGVVGFFENQLVRQMAGVANRERDAWLDGDLDRAVQGIIPVGQRVVDGFANELVGVFSDHGPASFK